MFCRLEKQIGDGVLSVESGKVAKQANGATVVALGDTVVLVAATEGEEREFFGDDDMLPLTVEYREQTSAAGKIPGGFFKREGRPTTKETLTCRLIDRPIRPLFPSGFRNEIQVFAIVLSADKDNDPDILAMNAASAALVVSDIPFAEPVGSVRIGRVNSKLFVNPTRSQLANSDLDFVVSGTASAVMMVEGFGKEIPEETVVEVIAFAHGWIKQICALLHDLAQKCGKKKHDFVPRETPKALHDAIREKVMAEFRRRMLVPGKQARARELEELRDKMFAEFCADPAKPAKTPVYEEKDVKRVLTGLEREILRELVLAGKRVDGRPLTDTRHVACDIAVLPRTHGSALFTRGETQALVVTTLGTGEDEQIVDGLEDEYKKRFMLHYNFPSFCVGETKPARGPSRREIGHGNLAERSIEPVLPQEGQFPYTIRIVSNVLESNGSSSMATVCGGSLSLMDAGVPITAPVAGVAMGVVEDGANVRVLTDIVGVEDRHGDMDMKAAGTRRGITAIQMDIKREGVSLELTRKVLEDARKARNTILDTMLASLPEPRRTVSTYAPRLVRLNVPQDKIGAIIGPGGKIIRKIEEETGAKIEIDDDGVVTVSALSGESLEKAKSWIEGITEGVKVGTIYKGRVTGIKDFGAFVAMEPSGQEGLVHVSELADTFVQKVEDVVKFGDTVMVKVIAIEPPNRVRLSIKRAKPESPSAGGPQANPPAPGPGPGTGRSSTPS
ncbi:MAG: polyribonucleotide nucleotidyltransferase [Planctomycetota bacterium]|nr:polyribonucleotide nucleotidyltransferase [Planctomycetota bacterium]